MVTINKFTSYRKFSTTTQVNNSCPPTLNIESIALKGAEIFSSTGSTVGRQDVEGFGSQSIRIDHLKEGMYIFTLKLEDGSIDTQKMLVQ